MLMMDLDLTLGSKNNITLMQFDAKETIKINVFKDRYIYNLSGKTIRLQGIKADGNSILIPTAIILENVLEFEVSEQLTIKQGIIKMQLLIFGSSGSLKNSKIFTIAINESLEVGTPIISTNDFLEIKNTLIKVDAWDKEFTSKTGILEQLYTVRLNGIDSQMAESKKQLIPQNYNGCVVTFMDDDMKVEALSKWIAIANLKGIKISFGAVKDWIGTSGYLTLPQIQDIQSQGHDILNHTKAHLNNWAITDSEIETEILSMQNYMKQNNLNGYDTIVYPGSVPNDNNKKNIVRKYAKYGISNTYELTKDVIDNYYLYRVDSDFRTLAQMQAIVNQFEANNQWLIILTHSWRAEGDINSNGTFSTEKIKQLIDYIKGKNIPILSFSEAEKLKGISSSIGDYSKEDSLYIGKDSKFKIPTSTVFIKNNTTYTLATPITDFKENAHTYAPISNTNDTITSTGGILQVFRSSVKYFSYATFSPYNSNKIYRRQYNEISNANVWTTWEDITPTKNININTTYATNDYFVQPMTSFAKNMIDYKMIQNSFAQNAPTPNIGGILITYRMNDDNFSWQEYKEYITNKLWRRAWSTGGNWLVWELS